VPALALVALDDFRGDVVGRPADRLSLLVLVFDARRQPEIADFDFNVLVEEQVPQLEIAVDDVFVVHVPDGQNQLRHEVRRLRLRQALPSLDHLVHALVVTELQQNVAVIPIFEEVLVLADVFVLESPMNLDFRLQLRVIERP